MSKYIKYRGSYEIYNRKISLPISNNIKHINENDFENGLKNFLNSMGIK